MGCEEARFKNFDWNSLPRLEEVKLFLLKVEAQIIRIAMNLKWFRLRSGFWSLIRLVLVFLLQVASYMGPDGFNNNGRD